MNRFENHYCCQCHRTTRFHVRATTFTCTGCGVIVEKEPQARPRVLIGNPMRSYKTSFAA